MSTETDARQSALEMLRDTLSAEDGAGSDLSVFRLEEGGEWAEVQGYIDMGHLVSEVVSWAREQGTREPSEDPCPEWQCPDLSSEDRREGKTCPDHPCTCTRDPSDAEVLEASLTFERVWDEIIDSFDPERDDGITYIQAAMRAALIAAQEARDDF